MTPVKENSRTDADGGIVYEKQKILTGHGDRTDSPLGSSQKRVVLTLDI